MITLVDGTVPVANDFNSNFTALNQVCGTATSITGYTAGDLLYASASNALAKLAIGTTGQVLSVVAGAPAWSTITTLPSYVLRPESAIFPTTNFPQLLRNAGTNVTDVTLDYDQTTSEAAFWYVSIPNGVTVTAATLYIFSRQAAATTGTVGWTITSLTRGAGDVWDTAGVSDTVTADAVESIAGKVHVQSKALTVTGWAADRVIQIKIARDMVDTVAEDVKFIGALLKLS